jgi:hypothetical protein
MPLLKGVTACSTESGFSRFKRVRCHAGSEPPEALGLELRQGRRTFGYQRVIDTVEEGPFRGVVPVGVALVLPALTTYVAGQVPRTRPTHVLAHVKLAVRLSRYDVEVTREALHDAAEGESQLHDNRICVRVLEGVDRSIGLDAREIVAPVGTEGRVALDRELHVLTGDCAAVGGRPGVQLHVRSELHGDLEAVGRVFPGRSEVSLHRTVRWVRESSKLVTHEPAVGQLRVSPRLDPTGSWVEAERLPAGAPASCRRGQPAL